MRVDLKKVLFLGAAKKKDDFFEKAQKLGLIDFIEKKGKKPQRLSTDVLHIIDAIKVLRTLNPVVQYDSVPADKTLEVVHRINESAKRHSELQTIQEDLIEKIEVMTPYGAFDLEKVRRLEKEGKVFVQFFAMKKGAHPDFPDATVVLVGHAEDVDYYFSVGKTKLNSNKIIEIEVAASKEELQKTFNENSQEIDEIEKTLKECSHYKDAIHHLFLEQLNEDHLLQALDKAEHHLGDNLFVIGGWIPVNKTKDIDALCKQEGVLLQDIKVESHELVPTNLENEGFSKVGEDLVHIYDTPANNDKDPSLWVLFSFALFFAIIVGDAGYGMIYLLICGYIWWKHPKLQGFKRRVLTLSTVLSVACVIWGVLAGAYFGISLSRENPLRKYSLISYLIEKKAAYHIKTHDDVWQRWVEKYPQLTNVQNPNVFLDTAVQTQDGSTSEVINIFTDNIMLELALFVGVLHLILSMARYATRHWSLFGWILLLIGGYLWVGAYFNYTTLANFLFGISKETARTVGGELAVVGIVIAVVCAFIQERLYGILEITKLINILADTLSYLRLYALGMAGGILASTINGFADSMPLIVGILLAFFAHTFNMALGIMGGVIHGLRLNFIEWYHYSFYGSGKQFKPLRILTKDE